MPPIEVGNDRKIDKLNLNTLLDNRIIAMRNPKVRAILKIADGVMYGFREFLRQEGFTEFVPPKIVSEGAEGGADHVRGGLLRPARLFKPVAADV